jgi:hypothetical protein
MPSDIEKCIRAAQLEGWSPASRRRLFTLKNVPNNLADYGPIPRNDESSEARLLIQEIMSI